MTSMGKKDGSAGAEQGSRRACNNPTRTDFPNGAISSACGPCTRYLQYDPRSLYTAFARSFGEAGSLRSSRCMRLAVVTRCHFHPTRLPQVKSTQVSRNEMYVKISEDKIHRVCGYIDE